jgi:cell wall-associated NlpC family hydrolase
VWGGSGPNGYDCSGLTMYSYAAAGIALPHSAAGQSAMGMPVSVSQLQPGDLLFFGTAHFASAATESDITHEGIYLGDNWVIHSSGQGVYVEPLTGGWLGDEFAWGRRVIG